MGAGVRPRSVDPCCDNLPGALPHTTCHQCSLRTAATPTAPASRPCFPPCLPLNPSPASTCLPGEGRQRGRAGAVRRSGLPASGPAAGLLLRRRGCRAAQQRGAVNSMRVEWASEIQVLPAWGRSAGGGHCCRLRVYLFVYVPCVLDSLMTAVLFLSMQVLLNTTSHPRRAPSHDRALA